MSYRDPKKNYDLFSALSKSREQSEREIGILKLKHIIDWKGFRPLLEEVSGYRGENKKKGASQTHSIRKDSVRDGEKFSPNPKSHSTWVCRSAYNWF